MKIEFFIYEKGELYKKVVNTDLTHKLLLSFRLKSELDKIRNKFLEFQKKGIIKSNSKNPKCLNPKFRNKIKYLTYSRKTINEVIKNLKQIFK